MSKIFFFIFVMNFSLFCYSQQVSVSYELNSKKNPHLKRDYILDINEGKSVFRTASRKISDINISEGKFGFGFNLNPNFELYFIKDRDKQVFNKIFFAPMTRDKFFIPISEVLNWQILSDTITIGNFKCQKATVKYGGRNWTAWFNKDILIPEGPYYFNGLPGLIMQIQDESEDYIFQIVEIKKSNSIDLHEMRDGIEINWDQYRKIILNYYQDPYSTLKIQGIPVFTDKENGGYKEVDYRVRTKEIREMLIKENNPIELNEIVQFEIK
ncbi:GLPGLI family protein [Chryseobacterium taklimakanense]|uniref:GLPGLI family protein n=1 Tax=Chryseobacterium taklimakanense TaxID=536441 RepID=UPI0013DE3668|nr:GLPGLI family protein [Chryseobacterium taklimakanense]